METVTLNNGMEMPLLGFGTYQLDENATAAAVLAALKTGYRLIDTAQYYGNEQTVGQAIRQSGIGRDQLFITTKTPLSGYAEAKAGVDDSLMACGVDYLDLMLIHWPVPNFMETYEALEDTVKEGKVRALGLSNFNAAQVQRVLDEARVKPVLDQVETHLLWQQAKLHAYLTEHDLVHQAWSPLGQGTPAILNSPALLALGAKYHKTGPGGPPLSNRGGGRGDPQGPAPGPPQGKPGRLRLPAHGRGTRPAPPGRPTAFGRGLAAVDAG